MATATANNNKQHNNNNNMNNNVGLQDATESARDEVDFIVVANNLNNQRMTNNNYDASNNSHSHLTKPASNGSVIIYNNNNNNNQSENQHVPKLCPKVTNAVTQAQVPTKRTSVSAKERLSLFAFGKRTKSTEERNCNRAEKEKEKCLQLQTPAQTTQQQSATALGIIATPPRQHKFVKSASIARLLGNTYNAKKFEKSEQKRLANGNNGNALTNGKFNTYGGGRRHANGPFLERFKSSAKDDDAIVAELAEGTTSVAASAASTGGCGGLSGPGNVTLTTDTRDVYGGSRNELVGLEDFQLARPEDLGAKKALRTISRGLGKLWWRRTHSVDISTPDPEYKVSYLGNVLTGWAKGEGCVEKQLNTLWRNYTQNTKPDVIMRIKVCASGLKATTRQHGLTEYWANRITHCCAPQNYPRVFCWIYRHEGRKLKHELRCHAVLCSKEKVVQEICNTLKENLESALREFKREKLLKQNARLSLANAAYDNPSLPRRKILLSVGGNNYRPPLERSKSAPKLMAIEEAIGEEDGDEVEETNEPEMKSCCQKDSLYPAMTLGRRRCRRGHSIRRTGKARMHFCTAEEHAKGNICGGHGHHGHGDKLDAVAAAACEQEQRNSYGSDESDDFEKLLKYNDYDRSASLANELLPYFDMQLHKQTSASLGSLSELKDAEHVADDVEPLSLLPTINSDPSADPEADFAPIVTRDDLLDDDDDDVERNVVVMMGLRRNGVCSDGEEEDYLDADEAEFRHYRQASILNMLHRNSMRKMAQLSLSSDESSIETHASAYRHQVQSSISSNASSTASTSASAAALEALQAASANVDHKQQQQQHSADSDEGSISSGCETASTVTANQDDVSLKYRQSKQRQAQQLGAEHKDAEAPLTAEEIYQRLEARHGGRGRHNSDATTTTTYSSSSSITLKLGGGGSTPTESVQDALDDGNASPTQTGGGDGERVDVLVARLRRRQQAAQREQSAGDSDSECSDESGYVEFQERERERGKTASDGVEGSMPMPRATAGINRTTTLQSHNYKIKPQLPPKPPKPLMRKAVTISTTTPV